jgi:UDP-N-acetylmuramyl pentapeptide phosphotransferase/UDP-N-acetylglucosamine-1-phosphate transferase
MTFLFVGFFTSLITCLLLIRYKNIHAHLSGDHQAGPQKMHQGSTPRIGGLAIFLSILAMWITQLLIDPSQLIWPPFFVLALPVFLIGLYEDISKHVGVKVRLFAAMISAILVGYFLNIWITRLDIYLIDSIIAIPMVSILLTVIAISGVANAYNIIDGFNGLASAVGMIALLAIAYVAFKVGDLYILRISFAMIAAILGFFIWNYPRGLIFLGDGGAYLIGFWVASSSIYLVAKYPEVSAWFALLVNAYPVMETLFTMWRRKIHQGKSPGLPDAAHFHSLIYRRVMKWANINDGNLYLANAKTSPYLWILSSLAVFPAMIFWSNTLALQIFAVLFCLFYLWIYRCLVTFKTPKFIPRTKKGE